MNIYEYSLPKRDGSELQLKDFAGKVLIIANTASKCGFTYQYEALEELYKEYNEKGLEIIAVPSNQFSEQEPGTNNEIEHFCKVNYGVTFTVAAKSDVRDENALPVFNYLTKSQPFQGFKSSEMTDTLISHLQKNYPHYLEGNGIKWNFTKFLINKKGDVVGRFEPVENPSDMKKTIEKLLAE